MAPLNPIYKELFKKLSQMYEDREYGQYVLLDEDAVAARIADELKQRGVTNGTVNQMMQASDEKFSKRFSYYMNTYTATSRDTVLLPANHLSFICREFDISPQKLLYNERGSVWLPRNVSSLIETIVAEPKKDDLLPKLYYMGAKLIETYPLVVKSWYDFFLERMAELDEGIDGGINRVLCDNDLYRIKARLRTITADTSVRVRLPATIAAHLDQPLDFFMIPDYSAHNDLYIVHTTKNKEVRTKIVNSVILDIVSIYLRLSKEGQVEFNKGMLQEILSANKTAPAVMIDTL